MKHPMEVLKSKLYKILDIIPPNSKIIYFDYPVHTNVGDLLILVATEKFFKNNYINIINRFCLLDYPLNLKINTDIILVFQGGGNFGDLYPHSQRLREYFIKNYKNNRIVILPQTIHFEDSNNFEKTSDILQKHPDLHIFVRDKRSYKIAKDMVDNVYLVPDMAHFLWPIKTLNVNSGKYLFLLRTDKESIHKGTLHFEREDHHVIDWPNLIGKLDKCLIWTILRLYWINRKLNIKIFPMRLVWYRFSNYLIGKCIRLFSNYSHIVTSRLHGHILACLMEIPNTLLDNSYGKNEMYYKTWTYKIPYASFKKNIKSFEEVI